MKNGMTLNELAKELKRRADAKQDFVAPVSKLAMAVVRDKPVLQMDTGLNLQSSFDLNKIAHEQVSDFAGIPMQYYRKMLDNAPGLLADNVNRWLQDRDTDRRMVRTMDGTVRALLSDKYRALENEDLAEAILPVLLDRDLMIMSCEVTDSRLYIKAVDRRIERDVPTGRRMGDGTHTIFDTVCPAIVVSNSEVGRGSLAIESGVFTRACTNMAIFGANMRKYHTGARAEISDEVYTLLSDKTRRLTDAAVWSQTRDLVAAAFDEAKFGQTVEKLHAAAEDRLPKKADVVKVIDRAGKKFGLSEGERKGVLQCLIEDGDLSRYGLHSAVTRFSQDDSLDYDRATELERLGARIVELPKHEWKHLAEAA